MYAINVAAGKGMNLLNKRVKELRAALKLSAEKFGSRVGVTRSAISRIENGVVNVTEQMILAICREFNVNEEWLRSGKGDMFLTFTEDEFSKAAATLSNDAFVRSLIVEYWKLDETSKKLFRNFIHNLSNSMKDQEAYTSSAKKTVEEPTIEELEAEYKKSVLRSAADTESSVSSTIAENGDNKVSNQ